MYSFEPLVPRLRHVAHQDQSPRRSPSRALIAAWAALAAVVCAAWANSIGGGPIFDDHILVVGQQCIRSMEGVLRIFRFESDYACTYRPIRYISYGIDHGLFGGNFWGFHVGNIANHLFAVFTAAGLVSELTRRAATWNAGPRSSALKDRTRLPVAWVAFAVVALWALHPAQTDSVSYVSGRRDILAGAWTFASVWAALVADRRGGLWWLLPLWATLIAFLSKESAVVVPALFLLWKVREVSLRAWLRDHMATAIAGGVGLVLSFLMVLYRGVFASMSHREGFAWWGGTIASNFATVAVLQVHYLRHVLLMHPLIGDYQTETIPLAASFADPRAMLGVALVLGLLAAAWLCRKSRPLISYGIGWYFIALAPVCHFFPHHELFAEHYLYIPLLGILLALVDAAAWAIESAPDRARWQRIGAAVLAVLMVVMVLRVVARNRDFADERAFYENVVAEAPNNVRGVANLANIYFDAEEFEPAQGLYERLAPRWIPGSDQERVHVLRLVEAAYRNGDTAVARAAAEQVETNHPDIGAGHKWVARLAEARGDHATAFDAGLAWWRTTQDPRALHGVVGAWHAGALGAERAAALADAVEAAPEPTIFVVRGTADALRQSGDPTRGLALLVSRRPAEGDAELEREACALARAVGSAALPGFCP